VGKWAKGIIAVFVLLFLIYMFGGIQVRETYHLTFTILLIFVGYFVLFSIIVGVLSDIGERIIVALAFRSPTIVVNVSPTELKVNTPVDLRVTITNRGGSKFKGKVRIRVNEKLVFDDNVVIFSKRSIILRGVLTVNDKGEVEVRPLTIWE